jgi:pyridoxal phosphate-dependent aminotransferase EpsN
MGYKIFLSPPHMGDLERNYLLEAFDSNWIAPVGKNIDLFEEETSHYVNRKYALAVNSGTSALHLSLISLGIEKNDVVLCPSFTFAASANVILYQNATPVFIDVNLETWTIDVISLEKAIKKYKPKALITVDLYGQMCNYNKITDLCKKYKIFLIEDAAESLGSTYKDIKAGNIGDISILSFNGNKIITTSSGGMFLTDNKILYEKAKLISNQAKESKKYYHHKNLGYNYRMSNLLAAIGRGQLSVIEERVYARRDINKRYKEALSGNSHITFLNDNDRFKSNKWLTCIYLNQKKINPEAIINEMDKVGIETRRVWKPMQLQPYYKKFDYVKQSKIDNSKMIFRYGLCLPSGSSLSIKDQNFVIENLLDIIKKINK